MTASIEARPCIAVIVDELAERLAQMEEYKNTMMSTDNTGQLTAQLVLVYAAQDAALSAMKELEQCEQEADAELEDSEEEVVPDSTTTTTVPKLPVPKLDTSILDSGFR